MRWLLSIGLALCGLLLSTSTAWADEISGYATPLFNGQDLDGWHVSGCQVQVKDGAMLADEGNGLVRTAHRYSDFVLELDWKPHQESKWDSGIYIRSELPTKENQHWPDRYQINLLQGHEGNLIGLPQAVSSGLVKPGDWNHFKITAVGGQCSLEINGQPAWSVGGLEAASGYIGFQIEAPIGGAFEFKNIAITELDFKSLFNGRDLSGWEGGGDDAAKCWQVSDGTLICTGQPGPWLRSDQEYADFNLRFEYLLKTGGNSGIYARVPLGGAHREKDIDSGPSGVEVQLLDDAAERYRESAPYQFSGSLYSIVGPEKRVSRPAGEWNRMEIDARGDHYRIYHNGELILTAHGADFPELARRQLKGFIGLQNHSEEVAFRNLRIGPPQP